MPTDAEIITRLLQCKADGELFLDESSCRGDIGSLSEKEINTAEERLGFQLPNLLRRIYNEVGNGGFGEYNYFFIGLVGGHLDYSGLDAVSLYLANRTIDNDDPFWAWPKGLLPLVPLGCAMFHCVKCDVVNAPVFWFEPNVHTLGQSWEDSFFPFYPSLNEYLSDLLDGKDFENEPVELDNEQWDYLYNLLFN